MSVTKVSLTYFEGDVTTGEREVVITRTLEEFTKLDMLYFLADAMRSAGFSDVERIGCCNINSVEIWSEY